LAQLHRWRLRARVDDAYNNQDDEIGKSDEAKLAKLSWGLLGTSGRERKSAVWFEKRPTLLAGAYSAPTFSPEFLIYAWGQMKD
jgi:hypothetical protein